MRRHLVTLALLAPTLAALPAPAAVAGAVTCQGRPATIQGTTGLITGTEGDDVIVATQFATIRALGGDDVICSSGGILEAGAGDDSVLVALAGANLQSADLGPGSNTYRSPSALMIDSVTSGASGEPNTDDIDTGPGADGVTATLAPGSHPTISSGPAEGGQVEALTLRAVPGDSAAWDVVVRGSVQRDGVAMGTFTGWGFLGLDLGAAGSVHVVGTPGAETVRLGTGTVDVDLGGGDDAVRVDRLGPRPTSGRIELGSGRDLLSVESPTDDVDLDLDAGRLGGVAVSGVDWSVLAAPHVRFRGSPGADEVYAVGCRVVMRGGAGADLLHYANDDQRPSLPPCGQYRFTLLGQDGRDDLLGWRDRDRLVGGAGRDRADGRQGIDVCRAEREVHCER